MSIDIEVIRKIHDNEDGSCITVSPDVDGLGLIEIIGPESDRLVLKPKMASALAQALLETCHDLEQSEEDARALRATIDGAKA